MITLPDCPEAPHRAVLFLQAEVHEVTARGECSGRPVMKVEPFPVCIDGPDRPTCIRRLNEFLAEVKKKCQPGK